MTAMMVRRLMRNAPQAKPIVGTLLDNITIGDIGPLADPAGLYVSYNCMDTDATTTMCPDGRGSKTFSGPVTVDGIQFAVYTGLNCKALGLDWDAAPAEMARVQKLQRSKAIEKALMQDLFTGLGNSGDPATDLTPASGAVSPEIALAILEQDSAVSYAGQPLIHTDRATASLLVGNRGAVDREGNRLITALGTPLVAGAGYSPANGPDAQAADPGTSWMWATGQVTVDAGRERVVPPQLNRGSNEMYSLLEQFYVADADCYIAAVKVKIYE